MAGTLLVVAGIATAGGLALLLACGHRWRRDGVGRALLLAVPAALVSGEVAARWLRLPSGRVVVAEVVLVATAALVGRAARRWNPPGVWFLASLVVTALAYLACAAEATVADGLGPVQAGLSAALWLLEASALGLAVSFAFETCDVVCRTRWTREVMRPAPTHPPFVSLHVAAYNEPPEMLIETIRSLEALDYPWFEIVVVDNNTEDEEVWRPVEEYCHGRPGVRFVHVAPWPGYKAGALNLALDRLTDPRAEVVGIVDADYLVDPGWLRDLVGWFANPTVAFVQCPQDYDEWQGDAYLTACRDSYAYFFAASMQSRNERNSAIFGGTMGLIRRGALDEVGGWDEWCITEDAEASLRLYMAGYQGVYIHQSYGRGIMPLTFDALKRQRFRWCFGGMQIVKAHARALLPGRRPDYDALSARQRLDFLVGGLQWGVDLVVLGTTLVLLASAVALAAGEGLGFRPLGGPAVALPLVLAMAGVTRTVWALRVLEGISWRRAVLALVTWMSLSLTVAQAVVRGLVQREGVFLRTPKWRSDGGLGEALRAARPESALSALLLTAAAVAWARGEPALGTFAAWQAAVYAAAPVMAWLNLHTELSARLQRRQRSDARREQRTRTDSPLARVAAAVAVAGSVALVVLVARYPGGGEPTWLPERAADDAGPLGNLGLAPGVGAGGATSTTAPPAVPASASAGSSDADPATTEAPAGSGGATGTTAATTATTGATTPSTVPATPTTPTTALGNGTTRSTPTHTTGGPPTSRPGNGNG